VDRVDAASAILSGSEDTIEDLELHFRMRSVAGRSIKSYLAYVSRLIEQPLQERHFVEPLVRKFGVKPEGRPYVSLARCKRRRFWPRFRRCGHRQNVDASFFAIRRYLLWVIKKIEMAVEVDQTANPSEAR
jgi:hypothetical protein